jgi:hypothetical protein
MMQKYWSWVIRPKTSVRIFDDIKKEIVKGLFADVKKQWQNQENGSLHKNIINDNKKIMIILIIISLENRQRVS